jgi:hypothetical protein
MDKFVRLAPRAQLFFFHQPLDLACVETQIGDGSPADCEILELDGSSDIRLKLL